MANERETVSLQGMIRWALAECAAREIDALPDIQELHSIRIPLRSAAGSFLRSGNGRNRKSAARCVC